MWKQRSTTNLTAAFLAGPQGGPWGDRTPSPWSDGNKQSSLKSRPTARLTVLKPNTSIWGHQIPGKPATGKGPGTRPGSSPAVNSDDSHVCNTPWYIKFDSCQRQAMWKTFFNVCFVVGHECFFYNDSKINKKGKTGNYALRKVFLPQIFTRHLQKASLPLVNDSGKEEEWGTAELLRDLKVCLLSGNSNWPSHLFTSKGKKLNSMKIKFSASISHYF